MADIGYPVNRDSPYQGLPVTVLVNKDAMAFTLSPGSPTAPPVAPVTRKLGLNWSIKPTERRRVSMAFLD